MLSKAEYYGDCDTVTRSVNHKVYVRPRCLAVNVTSACVGQLPDINVWPEGPGGWSHVLFNIGSATYTIRDIDNALVGTILPGYCGRIFATENADGERFWHMESRQIRGGPPPYFTTTTTTTTTLPATTTTTGSIIINCMVYGTLVTMSSGEKRPIESLKVGDSLLGLLDLSIVPKAKVLEVVHLKHPYHYLFNERVRATADHPMYTPRGVIEAQFVTHHDSLRTLSGWEYLWAIALVPGECKSVMLRLKGANAHIADGVIVGSL